MLLCDSSAGFASQLLCDSSAGFASQGLNGDSRDFRYEYRQYEHCSHVRGIAFRAQATEGIREQFPGSGGGPCTAVAGRADSAQRDSSPPPIRLRFSGAAATGQSLAPKNPGQTAGTSEGKAGPIEAGGDS